MSESAIIKKIVNVTEKVHSILSQDPATRDNDNLLMIKIWEKEDINFNTIFHNTYQFAENFKNGKHTNPETIRRARQLLQAKHPGLRGKSYKHRHKEAEMVKKEINDI